LYFDKPQERRLADQGVAFTQKLCNTAGPQAQGSTLIDKMNRDDDKDLDETEARAERATTGYEC
jgi:hypothetical protein